MKKLFAKLCAVVVAACGLSAFGANSITVKDAVWGNVGVEGTVSSGLTGGEPGAMTSYDGGSYTTFNINFGDKSNITQTGIGGNGTVKIKTIKLFRRSGKSDAAPAKITISQTGKDSVESTSCLVSSQMLCKASYPLTQAERFSNSAVYVATFDSDVEWDTTANLTITFPSAQLWMIKPKNTTMCYGDWSPTIEITGDYTTTTTFTPIASWSSTSDTAKVADNVTSGKFTMTMGTGATANDDGTTTLTQSDSTANTGIIITPESTYIDKDITVVVTYSGFSKNTSNNSILAALWGSTSTEMLVYAKGNNLYVAPNVTSTNGGYQGNENPGTIPEAGKMMVTFGGTGIYKGTRVAIAAKNDDDTYGEFKQYLYVPGANRAGTVFSGLKIGGTVADIGKYHRPGMTVSAVDIYDTELIATFNTPSSLKSATPGSYYTVGAGTATSGVSINPVGGTVNIKDGTYYIAASSWSGTQTTVNIEDATLNCLSTFGVGTADYVVSGASKIYTGEDSNHQSFVLSQGDTGRNCSFTLKDDAEVVVGGSNNNNTTENQNSVMFGHWAGSTTFTIQDDAKFTAKSQVMVGVTHQDQTININGGTFTAQGIRTSANAWNSNNLNLRGGTLCLGDVGITQNGSYKIAVNALKGSTTIKATASTLPISQPITISEGATLTIDTDYASEITGTVVNNGTLVLKGKGSFTLPAANNITVEEGTTVNFIDAVQADGVITFTGDASKVKVFRADGTEITEKTVTTEGGVTTIKYEVLVSGTACWYDFTFTNTLASVGTEKGSLTRDTSNGIADGTSAFTENGKALFTASDAYMGPSYPTEWSAAIYAKLPAVKNAILMAFGTNAGGTIALIMGDPDNNIVKLVRTTGASAYETLATLTVPNATTASHLYSFCKSDKKIEIYLDRTHWLTYTSTSSITFGNGFQIGSVHGGVTNTGMVQYGRTYFDSTTEENNSTIGMLRMYKGVLGPNAVSALVDEGWAYVSPNGTYTRTITGTAWLSTSDNTWTKVGETEPSVGVPPSGSAVEITAESAATLNLNAALSTESLSLKGDITVSGGAYSLVNQGITTIDGNFSYTYGKLDITGGPTVMTSGSTLTVDASALDISSVYKTTFYPVTGVAEAGNTVTITAPEGDTIRTVTTGYNTGTEQYGIFVTTDHEEGNVYWVWDGTTGTGSGNSWTATTTFYKDAAGTTPITQLYPNDVIVINSTNKRWVGVDMGGRTLKIDCNGTIDFDCCDATSYRTFVNGNVVIASGSTINFVNDGWGNPAKIEKTAISGDGAITVAGTLTFNDTTSTIANSISGAGTIQIPGKTSLSLVAPTESVTGWTGTVEILAQDAETKFGEINFNNYGNASSKVKIDGISKSWLTMNATFNPEVVLAGDFTVDEASNRTYGFTKMSGEGTFTLGGNHGDGQPQLTITELDGSGVTVVNKTTAYPITITTLALAEDATVTPGTQILSKTGSVTVSAVTVGGEATTFALATKDDGVYVASASITTGGTTTQYAMVAEAIAAVEASSGTLTLADITVVDGATIPEGYKLVDGKLVKTGAFQVGANYFATLGEAIDAVKDDGTITMTADYTLESTITLTKAITLDTGTKTLTSNVKAGEYAIETTKDLTFAGSLAVNYGRGIKVTGAFLTVEGMIAAYRGRAIGAYQNATVAVTSGAEILTGLGVSVTDVKAGYDCSIALFSGTTAVINGQVYNFGYAPCISGNNTVAGDVTLTIGTSAIVQSTYGTALYLTFPGTTTVEGGMIDGGTAGIEVRGGTLNVKGGQIMTDGVASKYDADALESGCPYYSTTAENYAGILVIHNASAYDAHAPLKVSVTGGYIDSVASIGLKSTDTPLTKFVSGGYFKADPTDFIDADVSYVGTTSGADYPYAVAARTAKTFTVTLSSDADYLTETLTFPTVSISIDADYDVEWSPDEIDHSATETKTYTVTVSLTGAYKGTATKTFTAIYKATVQPIDPTEGGTHEYTSDDEATKAAAAINNAKGTYIKAPNGLSDDDKAAYSEMFTASANGKFVTVALTEAGTNAVQKTVTDCTGDVLTAALAKDAKTAAVTTTPGIYYAIEYGTTVNRGYNTAGEMATSSETALTMPTVEGDKAFFRVKASVTPIAEVKKTE